MTNIVSLHY